MANKYRVVGQRLPKADAALKATGDAKFAADLAVPGMLWGRVLRSHVPHAKILHIDTSRAERLPGVRAVVTGQDFPPVKYGFLPSTRDQYPLCRDKVRYIGDELAAVAAVDKDVAEEALDLIRVEYEELPAVFDPEEAMLPGAPQLHDHVENNVSVQTHMNFGDVEQAFKDSYYVREDRFVTQSIVHGFIEPHATLVQWDAGGKITLQGSKQSPYIVYRNLARSLDVPPSQVRLISPYVGGGFGGKQEPIALDFAAALLSKKTGRPVKIVYDQEEVLIGARRRHAMVIRLKTGVKKDGTLTGVECKLVADGGAYSSVGALSIYLAGAFLGVPFRVPNLKYDAYRVYTNKPFAGALRGHGLPQTRFAAEQQLEMIAEELGIDPLEIRLKNAYTAGETSCNGFVINSCGLTESLLRTAEVVDWKGRKSRKKQEGTKARGIGIASNSQCTGARMGGHNAASAVIKVHEDGGVTLQTGATDVGQGCETVLAQIVAEELGLDFDEVHVTQNDTEVTPIDPGTYGSRVTFTSGNAARAAAADIRRQVFSFVAEKLEADPEDLEIGHHKVYVKGSPERGLPWLSAVRHAYYSKDTPLLGRGSATPGTGMVNLVTGEGNLSGAYSFGTQAAEVEVDTETGHVKIVNMVVSHDSGYAINPLLTEGQQEGSVIIGEAQVLYEELPTDKGQILATSFHMYGMPSAMDAPERIRTEHIETNDPAGPYGAKESGEGTSISTMPAIANAIYDAIGVRVHELPFTPEKVLKALEEKKAREQAR
ncbi:MAG: molybdopterin-dependent oxidoreductase [Deltaproteobacteria bacterium]|nr:molybdopterin-dependent oxidoreductase [Deltaproteobacteria bacterium]